MSLRQPIVTFVGHIDHGKTSLQDYIRQTAVTKAEAGAITQHIGSSNIPLKTVKKICGPLLEALKLDLTIPGLLFIDTPGHAAFTNIRKRGGNLADIAILVVNINEGIMPQTLECIDILKQYKTPFIIALNKIDLLPGWQSKEGQVLGNIQNQPEQVQTAFETKLYEVVGKLSELDLQAERFDRVEDYTKQVALVPTSAISGEGIPELLMVLTGLAQKYMEDCLLCNVEGVAKGTVIEVKEEQGMGTTLDVIIYDGTLNQNDTIVVGTLDEPVVAKVRGLLEPIPLKDMRDKKTKFKNVKSVAAAIGIKINATGVDDVVAGMPLRGTTPEQADQVKEEIKKEVEEVLIETDKDGIVIKADSLGSLEALMKLLKEKDIAVKKASIGNISKKDVSEAYASYESDPLHAALVGFNVSVNSDVKAHDNVKVLTNTIIYKLIDDFEAWQEKSKKRMEASEIDTLVKPAKVVLMKGYVFRQNNPAVAGVDIVAGTLQVNSPLMNEDGQVLTTLKGIQLEQKNIEKAEHNQQVAISMPGVTIGRQLNEGDTLYVAVPEKDFRAYKDYKQYLSDGDKAVLREIAQIMRRKNPVWGV